VVAVKFSLNQTIEHFDVLATFDLIKKDKSRMNIADIKIDGCKYLGSMYQNNIVGKLFKRLKSVSNLPDSCPVSKVSDVCILNLSLFICYRFGNIFRNMLKKYWLSSYIYNLRTSALIKTMTTSQERNLMK